MILQDRSSCDDCLVTMSPEQPNLVRYLERYLLTYKKQKVPRPYSVAEALVLNECRLTYHWNPVVCVCLLDRERIGCHQHELWH